jgi:uncharacterized protein with FMN-binding domain
MTEIGRTGRLIAQVGLSLSFALFGGEALAQPPAYLDGTYTATGWYGGLPSHIDVTVTLSHGVISAVSVTPTATVPESLALQRRFAAAVPAVVVGRPIEEVHVGRLAGSSGTPQGFNDAIAKIKKQAEQP